MVRGFYFYCEFLLTAVKVWVTLRLAGAVWEPRVDVRKRRITYVVSIFLAVGMNTCNNMISPVLFSKAFMVVIIFWMSWVTRYLYHCRYTDSFCLAYILWMMMALVDLFIQALAYSVLDFTALQRDILLKVSVPRAIYQLFGMGLLLWVTKSVCQLVWQWQWEIKHCLRWVWLLVLPLFFCVMYFQRIYLTMFLEMLIYNWWLFLLGSLLMAVSFLAYMAIRRAGEEPGIYSRRWRQ